MGGGGGRVSREPKISFRNLAQLFYHPPMTCLTLCCAFFGGKTNRIDHDVIALISTNLHFTQPRFSIFVSPIKVQQNNFYNIFFTNVIVLRISNYEPYFMKKNPSGKWISHFCWDCLRCKFEIRILAAIL